jgi:hypothetical protein
MHARREIVGLRGEHDREVADAHSSALAAVCDGAGYCSREQRAFEKPTRSESRGVVRQIVERWWIAAALVTVSVLVPDLNVRAGMIGAIAAATFFLLIDGRKP